MQLKVSNSCIFEKWLHDIDVLSDVFTLGLKFEGPLKPSNKKKAENSEDEAGPSTATQVTVKFKQTPRPNQKQITSYKSYDAKIASEKWVECELNTPDSAISKVLDTLFMYWN